MKIILDLEGDSANTIVHGEATIVGSITGTLVSIRMENPDRSITFDSAELLNAIKALEG